MISIITVCHNSGNLLRGYLASFLELHSGSSNCSEIEFIFVENSGDLETEMRASELRANGFNAQVRMVENRGFGAGCNEGAKFAQGDILVFANPDILFLTELWPLESEFSNRRWGTVRQKTKTGSVSAFDLFPEHRSLATEIMRVSRYMHKIKALLPLCYPVGAFMIVPRNEFLAVGGFNEQFFMYYEEAELSRRLQAKLGPPSFSKTVSILHEGFGTQSSNDFTYREEANGLVTYANLVGKPKLIDSRLRLLNKLAIASESAALRARYLKQAMKFPSLQEEPKGDE